MNRRCWVALSQWWTIVLGLAILGNSAQAQKQKRDIPLPTQFEIGRHTYFDFGPPSDYYEIYLVRPDGNGSSVERMTLTPHGMGCIPARLDVARATLQESVPTLLGNTNPCAIPAKELKREAKRCKHCLNFSGAIVAMQVVCGSETRLIGMNVLERDWFDSDAKTPERTSWGMRLLGELDKNLGPSAMDRPMFDLGTSGPTPDTAARSFDSGELADLASGKYDALFASAPDKPSELYRQARVTRVPPSVELVSSTPFAPEAFVKPDYPAIAVAAHIEGPVSFTAHVDENGRATNVLFISGMNTRLMQASVQSAVSGWRFAKDAAGHDIQVTVKFESHCPND